MNPDIVLYRTLLAADDPLDSTDDITRSEEPRRSNLSATLALLHLFGQQSRSDLVTQLGVSRSTVGSLITELVEAGIAVEAGVARQPSPGRPSQLVTLTPGHITALAVEVGPAHVGVATMGLGGEILTTARRALHGTTTDLSSLASTIEPMVAKALADLPARSRLVGTGVAVAGLVSADGVLQHAPNLGWTRTDVRRALGAALPADVPVSVGNESTLAAVGEYLRGSLRGVRNALIVIGDIGVGGGAIVNGRLLRGADAMAGEVGHLGVERDGMVCRCGARGCWETRVGLEAVQRHTGIGHPPDAEDFVPVLLGLVDDGDPDVIEGLAETAAWLGWGLASLINTLNPTRIVIGGRLGHLLPHMRGGIEAELDRSALADMRRLCELVTPDLGKNAALIGAGEQVFWNAINNLDVLLDPPLADSGTRHAKE